MNTRAARVVLRAALHAATAARREHRGPEAVAAADAWVTRARARTPWWARADIEITNAIARRLGKANL